MYVKRDAEQTLSQLGRWYPIVAVTGPRQSGKTTLVRHLMTEKTYTTLEDLDRREFALTDPAAFLGNIPTAPSWMKSITPRCCFHTSKPWSIATAGKGYSFLPHPNSSVCAITSLKPSPGVSVFSNSCRYQ